MSDFLSQLSCGLGVGLVLALPGIALALRMKQKRQAEAEAKAWMRQAFETNAKLEQIIGKLPKEQ